MTTWTIPYIDQDVSFWEELAETYGEHIHSVYFPLPGNIVASGRAPQPDSFLGGFLQRAPFKKTVLVNPILLNRPTVEMLQPILTALRGLLDDFGVEQVTVSNLILARAIHKAVPELKICASTLMGISMPAQLLAANDCLDALVPDTRILRDLAALLELRNAFQGQVTLIVNEACLPGCLYRVQHFYEMAYSQFFPQSLCRDLLAERPWLRMTTGWILPQHLHLYDGLYDRLKLSGRVTLRDPAKYRQVLGAYINRNPLTPDAIGGGPASLLKPLDIREEWFAHTLRCAKDCTACTVCQDEYQRLTSPRQARQALQA